MHHKLWRCGVDGITSIDSPELVKLVPEAFVDLFLSYELLSRAGQLGGVFVGNLRGAVRGAARQERLERTYVLFSQLGRLILR